MCVGTGLWDGLGDRVKSNLFRQTIPTSGNNYVQVINAWAALGTASHLEHRYHQMRCQD